MFLLPDVESERQLWAAALLNALRDSIGRGLVNDGKVAKTLSERDAKEWFASNAYYVGSFKWICELLELEPDNIRRKIENEELANMDCKNWMTGTRNYSVKRKRRDDYGEGYEEPNCFIDHRPKKGRSRSGKG